MDEKSRCNINPNIRANRNTGGCCPPCENAKVVSQTLCECDNVPIEPPYYAKIPRVLAEFRVQIVVESNIELEEEAIEIKRIKKNLYLNQCRLVSGTHKVFLGGYIRKNIEYATKECVNSEGNVIAGDIKHTTVYVPFRCVTRIDAFEVEPDTTPNANTTETQFLDNCCCKCDKPMGTNRKEHDFYHNEEFNEPVYCELVKAEIYEVDIEDNCEKLCCKYPNEHIFKEITEKSVVELTIKLLQNQQIRHPHPPCKHHGC